MKYKLTVALITMNRADQLKLAIESCVAAALPAATQFVVVDNGSTDDTEAVVTALKDSIGYDLVYHKETVNRGVGGGRNLCFDLSEGEYVYFFDDDAEIPEQQRNEFFMSSLAFLDRNPQVALLTTDVKDTVFGERKIITARTQKVEDLRCSYTFHGGTVFARKSSFESPLFMNIMYGNEEIAVSMGAFDRGCCSVYFPDVYILHNPKVDKWKGRDADRLNLQSISNTYAIKSILYPRVLLPVLHLAYTRRLKKHNITDKAQIREFKLRRREFCKENRTKKIKISTVIRAYREFGLTVF